MSKRKTRGATATETPGADESDPMQYERAVDESTIEPPPELAPATVTPPQATTKPARPRRVSAEAVKAETRLANIQRSAQASIAACLSGWAKKRADFIATLPHDVQGMLLAGGVITDDDLEGLTVRETSEP